MEWYKKVNMDARAAYYLTLSEKLLDKLTPYDDWFPTVKRTIDLCWEWVEEKRLDGYDIYMEADDEDEGLFVIGIVEIDPFQGNSQAESAYWCVFDAVCYTIWLGFKFDNMENELPQPIESINDEMIYHRFMEEIRKVDGYQEEWAEHLKQYLLENYPAGSDKKMKREELLNLIA
ncbi:Imm6 family immunity protein [Thermoactinomyces sp. CICC 23799]|jgi:Immunity protein Imm6|uniref:Imm6 family immunity protein n=1 Tax=Thermoactinomyces sp. CICC 23799 TaxID=2767429 RepID=UPI0018DECC12|nr:Imm6 family immunity protein [Thermoactinomyces sp. CICC 23799]MBH8602598.1 hypothetical protein [Thermoactinomyces sp. CICC 23799]